MRGDEARVVEAYACWLERDDWDVQSEIDFVDIYAVRGDEQIYAEVKGRTTDPGLDVDTLYGQLLRRMTDARASARYAVVVLTVALKAALRVPGGFGTACRLISTKWIRRSGPATSLSQQLAWAPS
jgi:hypothetical protein